MPGDRYTHEHIVAMSREDFEIASANGFEAGSIERHREQQNGEAGGVFPVPAAGASSVSTTPTQITLGTAAPSRTPVPRADVWANRTVEGEDFVCPSGQMCKLRKLQPETLLQQGLLDQITRLEGLADELVQTASGQPPAKSKMPTPEDWAVLLGVINGVVPLAVIEPTIWPLPEAGVERETGRIYVDSIDLEDRMAILNKSLHGIRVLDRFHNA